MKLLILSSFILISFTFFSQTEKVTILPLSSVCKQAIQLTIKGSYTAIHYTTNGSIPTKRDKRLDDTLTIDKTTALLFRLFYKNKKEDTLIARSYIFESTSKLPVISITIPKEDLWDGNKGIYTRGNRAYFDDSTGHWENCNFQQKWEKEIQIVYIDSSRSEVINQSCGLRVFGESTRRQPDKSLKIVARKQYGKKRFNYSFFDQKPQISEFKQLVIRTSGNDYKSTRFKDILNAYLARNLGLDYMAYQQVRMYVNGEYWGLYNLREKINKHYLYYNHGAAIDSSSIIMGRWVTQHGNRAKYKEMYDWFFKLDTMDSISYVKANEYFDVRNYINYRAFQIFINNVDSRGNIRYWNSTDLDGKFRMILYDTDLSYGNVSKDYLAKCLSPRKTNWYNNTWSTIYFRKLMEHQDFKNDFINQYAHIMNTALHPDTILAAVDYFENIYRYELPRSKTELPTHFKNVPIPMEKWLKKVDHFRSFARKRTTIARDEITRTLSNEGTFYLKIEGTNGSVIINKNYAIKSPFEGIYYKNIPLPISIQMDTNYLFDGWQNGALISDTILTAQSDTIVLKFNSKRRPPSNSNEDLSTSISMVKNDQNSNNPLWLIAWIFIGLGGVLLVVYFNLRIK